MSEFIKFETLKKEPDRIYELIRENNVGTLIKLLDRLGKLSSDFDKKPLIELLTHQNERVRSLTVKNLAKLENIALLEKFVHLIENEQSSIVRREAVSAIGRMRNPINKSLLMKYLNDPDPEVVLQAMRGLLVFKEDKEMTYSQNKSS